MVATASPPPIMNRSIVLARWRLCIEYQSNTSFLAPKRHLDWFSRVCNAHRVTNAGLHVQVIACNELQIWCNNCGHSNVMENIQWLQHFLLMNIFHHFEKPAIIAQKLLRVACNKLHMKPQHSTDRHTDHATATHAHINRPHLALQCWRCGINKLLII